MKKFKILNSKKVQLLILMSLVLALTLGVYLYRGSEVALEVDGIEEMTVTYSRTVGDLVEEDEVDFREGAYVNLPLDTKIEDNLKIKIINPKTYIINDHNKMEEIGSIYETVGEVLKDKGIVLNNLDYTKPEAGEKLQPGDTIDLVRVKEEVVVKNSKIPFEKINENTNTLFKGETKLKQKGVEGLKATHVKNRYENGKLISATNVKEEIISEKQDNITLVGTKVKPVPKKVVTTKSTSNSQKAPSRSNGLTGSRTMTMSATAYDLSYASTGKRPGDRGYGITASGMKAGPGVVAVDPRVIPLGTRLYIEGYGNAIAGDTGGAIKGNKIDLFFHTASEVRRFGRRNVKVTILK